MTKLDPRALAYTGAAVCGLTAAAVALMNLAFPPYGQAFLDLLGSVYPGYHGDRSPGGALVLAGYAMVKGAALGWLTAALYNRVAR